MPLSTLRSVLIFALVTIGALTRLIADESPAAAELDLQIARLGATSLGSEGGRLARSSRSADLSVPLAGLTWMGLELDLSAERQDFRFSHFSAFLANTAAPLSRADDLALQPSLLLLPKGPWSVVISPKLEYSKSQYARSNDSRLWGLSTAVFYQSPNKLKIGLGVNSSQRLNASALILPFPVIDWQLSERWTLSALDGESGRLSFQAGSQVMIYGELQFKSSDIRLARSSSIPAGVLRSEAFPVLLGVEYRLSKHVLFRLAIGQAFAESFRFEDRYGRLLARTANHAPLVGTLGTDLSF